MEYIWIVPLVILTVFLAWLNGNKDRDNND